VIGYIVCPLLLLALILFATRVVAGAIKKYDITSMINE